jgi:hypothetical protein
MMGTRSIGLIWLILFGAFLVSTRLVVLHGLMESLEGLVFGLLDDRVHVDFLGILTEIGHVEVQAVAGAEALVVWDIHPLVVDALVEALGSYPREAAAVHVFGLEGLDVASVARHVLALEHVGGSADPSDTVANVKKVRHLLSRIHINIDNGVEGHGKVP